MHSHLPVGRLADYLKSLSRERAWCAVLAAVTGLALADSQFRAIGLTSLYIPIVCATCWTLGERAGYFVAVIAAILAVISHLAEHAPLSFAMLGLRATVRIATFLFVAATVASFRRSFDRERYLATRDRMTGALDKVVFRERVIAALDAAAVAKRTLLLVILDLDDFKAVNNRHGHAAGDAVLRALARGAVEIIRRDDEFGRIGGDEFALLVRVHSGEDGRRFAIALHRRLSAVLAGAAHPVTCSMGALVIPPHAPRDEATLMHTVDQLMYVVKRVGKNAVEIGEAGKMAERMYEPGVEGVRDRADEDGARIARQDRHGRDRHRLPFAGSDRLRDRRSAVAARRGN